jgi:hypothetical protein
MWAAYSSAFIALTGILGLWQQRSRSGSAALDGSLAVDLRTLDTGINLRNEHLEAGKTIRLLRPNSLVAAFLATLSLNPEIIVVPGRYADGHAGGAAPVCPTPTTRLSRRPPDAG